ncbi:TIGR00180 family glycosyltransferase [Pseudomonas gingeri]|uniref:TIGR00180 family glycosyltransferase n=1 Tax=Pseudomonas gingeri TaxID=117681 RepID=UPI0015A18A2A|nr:TIGR00180 family glycosyltransferase [Pseudomonas gingeri]NWA00903.1 TIGR00180 family glycosyltransferase [Pseudomonas gingeri]NWA16053.1 TIGR00180 family glycosyltransferase [Pseudomonas gingeri]NWA54243.1 TIGR00180 family glycosyltransferase [Pseudomonas gingeri]NWA97680.1 TIGR00180 family glycosyltransferase [Pseudomonas gingeri]NWB04486.1 TIGR00180 family glycosyltransferase [Pseudomonas gingeri]
MQGKYVTEQALVLGDLLTVVLVTHNRPAFLRRAVKFYSALPCKLLVLDSSPQACAEVAHGYDSVEYVHVPQYDYWKLQDKFAHGVMSVKTPYMVFAADDDFIVPDALNQSVAFLEANPDYGMCHGYCLMYLTLANSVLYYRRDKKVREDYDDERPEDRVLSYMNQYLPPFYAVHRTDLLREWHLAMPKGTSFQWQEIGHVYYMLARAKARILPIPYVVREINYGNSEHSTEVFHSLTYTDRKSTLEREAFADFLATLPTAIEGLDREQTRVFALESFEAMADSLRHGRALTAEMIFDSTWNSIQEPPQRSFGPKQYMEMPFYNQAFFDQLTQYEFLLHAMPAGRAQLQRLEASWTRQQALMRAHNNDTPESVVDRLWQALDCNLFNRRVVKALARQLELLGEDEESRNIAAWAERLDAVSTEDNSSTYDAMLSGRLVKWLDAREPDVAARDAIASYEAQQGNGPTFGLMLLDLGDDIVKLQVTLDSLLEGHSKAFRIAVFTTGEPQAATSIQNTLHFVRVTEANYVDKLNQFARQSSCDWLLLAEAGDEFTASGLLRAGLELRHAEGCRAVCTDEIQRDVNGALTDVFRPGFNLDLLQSVPAQMARHWLIRREVLVEAGGFNADFSKALEFDLLLRLIEQDGMGGLAHLNEPLLICSTPESVENADERSALIRHLGTRGYKAQVSSPEPGTYMVDYRHTERPLVSILLQGQDNQEELERCLSSVLLRTRYLQYEVLIVDNASHSAAFSSWLDEQQSNARVRVLRVDQRLSQTALYNTASGEARGEYLVLLDAAAEIVNPNWIESLLNQALRPEVGVVGAKLYSRDSKVAQAGLILGLNGGVGSAFVGEKKDAKGYMNRLLVEQDYSAVSGVCLMVRKALYEGVDGLDEDAFADAFADVDLCLKAGQAGYLVVWTPHVQVLHPGLLPQAPRALAALREKWSAAFEQDPAYNRNLSLSGKGFALDDASRVDWLQLLV